jgi:hypothetical protein
MLTRSCGGSWGLGEASLVVGRRFFPSSLGSGSVGIPSERMMTIAINWSWAKCPCPQWNANTDESALRSALASLDNCNSSLHWWLGFWTFLVALGVVLEVVFVVWEYLDGLHDFGRGIIHAPERPPTALFVLGLFGAGLVAAGVSGELWKESQIATVETCLRKGNDALFFLLSKEAGNAQKSAASAEVSANTAGVAAGKAQKKADAVAKRADELDSQLVDAKTKLDAVETRRAELEKSLVNLAVCSAPRVIQTWTIGGALGNKSYVDPLRPMAGQVVFIEVISDPEARRAARSLAEALTAAQWNVQRPIKLIEGLKDGVSVQPSASISGATVEDASRDTSINWHAGEVATRLLDFLHSYNWQAEEGYPYDQQEPIHDAKILPVGAIRIQIGLYPATTYVNPPGTKEAAAVSAEIMQSMENQRKKEEAERPKGNEKFLERLTPQDAQPSKPVWRK